MDSNNKIDLVVVYLKAVRQKVIVPEYYINGYNQSYLKHLKNKGNNAGRDHLIFWSSEIVEGEFYPDPDQNAKEMTTFPPEKNGWYRGRTLWFTDDLEEAKNYRDRKRNVVPPVYNEARLGELPLPVLVLCPNESNTETDDEFDDTDPLDTSAKSDNDANIPSITTNDMSSHLDEVDANLTNAIEFGAMNVSSNGVDGTNNSNNNITTNDMASHLDEVDANLTNATEFGAMNVSSNGVDGTNNSNNNITTNDMATHLDDTTQIETDVASSSSAVVGGANQNTSTILSMASSSTPNVQVKKEPQFYPMNEQDADVVANIFDGSYEKLNDSDDDILIHRDAYVPPPIQDKSDEDKIPYKVKANDIISANLPFATNEIGDRAYIVVKGQSFKEVCMTKNIIDGLTQYNSSGFRQCPKYHLRFIKALLIGLIGREKLAANQLDELVIEFIRDLYNIRLGEKIDVTEFEKIITEGKEQINNRNFY